ncbi:hypothetical protein [Crocosphaera sp. Alani8]|uniref:hypothetical protein n=1 Tax=Crocosphaera sp. Alani8 TaxID=3038952 RepID=UPI00313ED677
MEQQEQQLIDRLISLENRFQTLEKSLEAGNHPWGMLNASRVTGAWKQEKFAKLNITQQQLVDLYKDCPQILAEVAIEVSLTAQTYRQRQHGQIYLEKVTRGNYWLIGTEPESYWLVPKDTIKINVQSVKVTELLFDCKKYEASQNREFTLIQAAEVSPHIHGEQWMLKNPGELDFSERSVGSQLREELVRIREERLQVSFKLKQLNKDFWCFKYELEKLIEAQKQEVSTLHQQLIASKEERQELQLKTQGLEQQLSILHQQLIASEEERQELQLKTQGLEQQLSMASKERLKLEKRVDYLFELMNKES